MRWGRLVVVRRRRVRQAVGRRRRVVGVARGRGKVELLLLLMLLEAAHVPAELLERGDLRQAGQHRTYKD